MKPDLLLSIYGSPLQGYNELNLFDQGILTKGETREA
jgi:hypothetical protein